MPDQRLTDITDNYRYTFQKIQSIQAFEKYITKAPLNIKGWEDISYDDLTKYTNETKDLSYNLNKGYSPNMEEYYQENQINYIV